jgi:hypothetical protein
MKFSFEVQIDGYWFDAVGHEDGVVASVELKTRLGKTMCDWWISGLTSSGELFVLARLEFGIGAVNEREALERLPAAFNQTIKPMLASYRSGGGLPAAPNGPAVQTKQALCKLHLNFHELEGNIGKALGIRVSTARQYQLIKSFGLKAARPLIADREGLPISTISRRLYLAREDGTLQKLSDTDDTNN